MSLQNGKSKIWGKFLNYVRSWDSFGRKVGLTHQGDSEYKTLYGSFASIGLGIFIIRLVLLSFIPVFNREIDTS